MTVDVSFTSIVYTIFRPDNDNPEIAHKYKGELNIYDGRVTNARIAREIPKGAAVESVRKINYSFEVNGEKTLAWLIENGKMKE